MTSVAKLTIEIAANVARLQADMAKVKGTVEGAMGAVKSSINGVRAGLSGLAAGLSVGALTGFLKNAIDAADAMDDMSQKIGVSVEDLAGLQLAFKFGGVEASGLQTAMVRLASEASKNSEVFRTLGVSVKGSDGQLKSSREILGEVAEKFEGLDDGARKTALAVELFGKSGADLIPMLNGGAEGLAEFDAIAQKLGLTISSETAAQAAKFNDTLDLLGQGVQGIGTQVAANLLPTMQNLAGGFLEAFTQGDRLSGLSGALAGAMKVVASAVIVVVDIFRAAVRSIGSFADAIVAITEGRFSDAGMAIKNAFIGNIEQLKQTVASIKTVWSDTAGASVAAITTVRTATGGLVVTTKDAEKTAKKAVEEEKALAKVREMLEKATEEARKETESLVSAEAKTTEGIQKQVEAVRQQIAQFGKSGDELRALERGNLDFAQSVIEMNLRMAEAGFNSRELIPEYQAQLQAIKDLKAEQDQLYQLEDTDKYRQAAEALMAANKSIADTFKDDLLDSIKTAFLQGGSFGDAFARGLKAELIETFLDPALGNAINQAKSGNFSGILSAGAAGSVAGSGGSTLSLLLQNSNQIADKLIVATGATGQTAANMLQLGNNLSKIAPYAGSIAAVLQGDVRGGLGSAAGTYIGGALGGPLGAAIGGAIGSAIGGKLFGGGKISATGLDPAALKPVTDATQQGFDALLKMLGGTGSVSFGIGGNTGRQGQNANFNLSAFANGQSIFNSGNTAEGQADGLFLRGEIALNEANIADQTTRAIVAALKLSDFADNIDAVLRSLDPLNSSLQDLNTGLESAQALATINEAFKDMDGAFGTLSGASIETVNSLLALTGGIQGLQDGYSQFFDSFFTEQEKTERLTKQVADAFAAFGREVPASREALRELVDGLDLQDTAQQALFATILQLTPALETLADKADSETQRIQDSIKSLFGSVQSEIDRLRGELTGNIQSDQVLGAFNKAISEARAGNGDAIAMLPDISRAYEQFVIENAASALDVSRARGFLVDSLSSISGASNLQMQSTLPIFAPQQGLPMQAPSGQMLPASTRPASIDSGELAASISSLAVELRQLRTDSQAEQRAMAMSLSKINRILDRVAPDDAVTVRMEA